MCRAWVNQRSTGHSGVCHGSSAGMRSVAVCNTVWGVVDEQRFDPDLLDEEDPFEIDSQAAHLFKHPHL